VNFNDDTFSAIEEMLDNVGAPPGKTMASRILGLHDQADHNAAVQTRIRSEAECLRDAALREARSLTHERDNCREVLAREREERAAEKATLGAALHTLRAETETLGESVERLNAENERLAAQLEFAERVLTAGIRRVVP